MYSFKKMDDNRYVVSIDNHVDLHIVAGRKDYSAIAGHLLCAPLSGAGEFIVEDFGTEIPRIYSPELGLNVYSL